MKLRKPKRRKGNVERIIIPKTMNNIISLLPHQISEGMGFAYGVKKGSNIYLGTASYKFDICKDRVNPTSINLNGEDVERYVRTHNRMSKQGERTIPNFVQILYHSHPKLIERDLTEKDKEILLSMYPEFNGNLESLVKNLDNTWLSPEDVEFTKKYSSKGLSILSIGKHGDFRQKNLENNTLKDIGRRFLNLGLHHLFNYKKSRLAAFQVDNKNNVYMIPLIIAEESEDYRDNEISQEVIEKTSPLTEIFFEYSRDVIDRSKEVHPLLAKKALKMIGKLPVDYLSKGELNLK